MPWFTLHRNYSMSTTAGHVIDFKKGEKTLVPPACVPNAIALGAQPVDKTLDSPEIDQIPKEAAPVVSLTPDEKQKLVFEIFDKMLLRNFRGDFTASEHPHAKKLEELLGFPMPPGERDEMWVAYNDKKVEV